MPGWGLGEGVGMVIDNIIVLSLEKRQDRRDVLLPQIQGAMDRGVLEAKHLDVWTATPHRDELIPNSWQQRHGYYAAGKDHQRILERLWKLPGCNYALILEDDAEMVPDFDRRWKPFLAEVEEHAPDWLALWLGGAGSSTMREVSPLVFGCTSGVQCHAYLVNRPGIWRLYDHLWNRAHKIIDHAYSDLMGDDACIYRPGPWFFTTQGGLSDNLNQLARKGG